MIIKLIAGHQGIGARAEWQHSESDWHAEQVT